MSDFAPGFASRHDRAGEALIRAFAPVDPEFAAYDVAGRARGEPRQPPREPEDFAAKSPGPRHFSPASRDSDPTEGWDMFDAAVGDAHEEFSDPIEAARLAGFAAGFQAAQNETSNIDAQRQALAARIAEALAGGSHVDRDRLATMLRSAVMKLVAGIVDQAGISGELLAGRIEMAVDMIADSAESILLHVHPDDVALIEGLLPQTIFPVGDAAIERGGFLIESSSTVIEDGPALWLDQLAQQLDRVAVPPQC